MRKWILLSCALMMLVLTACGVQAMEKETSAKEKPAAGDIAAGSTASGKTCQKPNGRSVQAVPDTKKTIPVSPGSVQEKPESGISTAQGNTGVSTGNQNTEDIPVSQKTETSASVMPAASKETPASVPRKDDKVSDSGGTVVNDRTDNPIILMEEKQAEGDPMEAEPECGTEAYCEKHGHYILAQWVGDAEYITVEQPVSELHNICHACGAWLENMTGEERCSHLGQCRSACSCEYVQVGTTQVTYTIYYAHDICGYCGKDFGRNGITGG